MIPLVRFLLGFMLVLTSLFLVLLVLIQRGRGGGLAGAFGGMGGQSAFGTKAGDVFTRITVAVAAFWIGLCILSINVLGKQQSLFSGELGGAVPQAVTPQTQPTGQPATPPAAGAAAPESKPADDQPQPPAGTAPPAADEPTVSPPTADSAPAAEPAAASTPAAEPAAK